MYKLTDQRREKAAPILEKYRSQFATHGSIDCGGFESELRECWNLGYQPLKALVIALSKEEEFERMAAYYMQNQNTPGPVSEFKPRLAELYGVRSYGSPETAEKREAYWSEGNE